ncbi:kinase [Thraustotheca clavata]|uniref:Kinase n=1 Tax=Thraustotheca clavata TaxID=74557 RepID=A0A1W0A153_9STRA|nr:kinase [Thraustotheca clavata]
MGNAPSNQPTDESQIFPSSDLTPALHEPPIPPPIAPPTIQSHLLQTVENQEIPLDTLNPKEDWIEIGQGAQGKVYKASLLGTPVAIKIRLGNSITSNNSSTLFQEIKILQQLQHPKIVQYMGVATDTDGNLCIVSEYLSGGSLFNLLHSPNQQLTWRDNLLQYAIDLCQGMAYIHAQNPRVLHRDLKSANILIAGQSTVKIADIGLARTSADVMSSKGTERWCAPEILSGNSHYTEKVDVYSFGIVLWEMCTCAIPYQHDRAEGLAARIINDDYRPEFPNTMPTMLRDIYEDCVSSKPVGRPDFAYLLTKFRGNKMSNEIESRNGSYPVIHPNDCLCLMRRGNTATRYQRCLSYM